MTEKETSRRIVTEYYRNHREEVVAYVTKRMGCDSESGDIVQDVFVRLLQTDKMISPVTLPCLVYTIARNVVADHWRHRSAVEQYEHRIMMSPYIYNKVDEASVYSATEVLEVLERGMARLTEKQRTVYRMNMENGLRVSEIAERLGERYKSVENRLGVARKEVRNYVRRMFA